MKEKQYQKLCLLPAGTVCVEQKQNRLMRLPEQSVDRRQDTGIHCTRPGEISGLCTYSIVDFSFSIQQYSVAWDCLWWTTVIALIEH